MPVHRAPLRARALTATYPAALAILASACVSAGTTPSREVLTRYTGVEIVAMEPPPLAVPPQYQAVIPEATAASPFFVIWNGVALLVEAPWAASRASESARSHQAALDATGTWIPTAVIAEQARAWLASSGVAATVRPGLLPVPGVEDRGTSFTMENWLGPTRAWYDAVTTPGVRAPSTPPGAYVLEVGILNYELVGEGELLLQVVTKVVDPASGETLGRARADNASRMPRIAPLDGAFANGARRYKAAFEATSGELVKDCLHQLALIP